MAQPLHRKEKPDELLPKFSQRILTQIKVPKLRSLYDTSKRGNNGRFNRQTFQSRGSRGYVETFGYFSLKARFIHACHIKLQYSLMCHN